MFINFFDFELALFKETPKNDETKITVAIPKLCISFQQNLNNKKLSESLCKVKM